MPSSVRAGRSALVAAVAFTVISWGSTYSAIRVAVRSYPPGALALARFAIAAFTVGVVAALQARRAPLRRPSVREAVGLAATGLVGIALYSVLLNTGEQTVGAGTTSLLLSASPVFTALLAIPALGERLGVSGWAGVVLGFVGTAMIAVSNAAGVRLEPGVVTVVAASVCWSVYSILQKAALGRFTALEVTAYSFWIGTVALLPFAPSLLAALRTAPPAANFALVYLGVVPAGLAFLAWAYVCSHMDASRAAVTSYLTVPVALVVAWLALHEIPHPLALVGGAVTLLGVALVNTVVSSGVSVSPIAEP